MRPKTSDLEAVEQVRLLEGQIEAIHKDPFHWLLTCATRPVQPFHFENPAEPDLVSVVIPAYNGAAFLERCVQSVWQQESTGARVEILLCEDGSADNTYELALALQQRSPMPMQVLTHPDRSNRGVSASRNLGLRRSRGSYIALLDADDALLPQRLRIQLDYFACHPEVQCICSHGYNRDPQGNLVRGWNDTTIAGDYSRVPPPNDVQPPYTFDDFLKTDPVVNSTLLIRRDAVAAAGGYPEVMAHQAEDWLLLAKLSLEAPIALIEQPLIDYTIHPGSYSSQYFAQNLAYGVRIEFLFHLVHWMLQQPRFRERGVQVFRKNYPKLLAAHSNVALLLEEYHQRRTDPAGLVDFEKHLAELHAELTKLRAFKRRVLSLLGPFRWMPGMQRGIRALWRSYVRAAQRRSA
jgi:glycosyltransferase involved in cell wall biosynthesis